VRSLFIALENFSDLAIWASVSGGSPVNDLFGGPENVCFRNTTKNAVPGETIIGDLGLFDDSSELPNFSFGGILSFGFGILLLELVFVSSGAGGGDFGDLLRLRVEPRS